MTISEVVAVSSVVVVLDRNEELHELRVYVGLTDEGEYTTRSLPRRAEA